jgi:ribonuclease D
VLITDTPALARLCLDLATRPYVAVDTEFVGEHTYWPRLCLIQVAAGEVAAAIDPLSGLDLEPLFQLFSAPGVLKVLHSGRQDLVLFRRIAGRMPSPVCDTQIAAMACGFGDSVADSTLVSTLTGATINKSMQVTDWARRPLTKGQVEYALADVTHLCGAYENLRGRLAAAKRDSWIDEEIQQMASEAAADADPWTAWQRIQIRGADSRTLAVLREVAAWREICSARMDLPRPRVARDETLLDIAFRRPRTQAELRRIRGFANVPSDGAVAAEILAIIERALAAPIEDCPRPHQRVDVPEAVQSQVSLLQALLRLRCDEHGVAPRLVATRSDLEALAMDPRKEHRLLQGWRAGVFGDDALGLLRGELAMTGHSNGARVLKV